MKRTLTPAQNSMSLAEQAAHWWVAVQNERCSDVERRAFAEWVAHSPRHVEAFLRLAGVMIAVNSPMVRWPDTSAEALIREAREAAPSGKVTSLHVPFAAEAEAASLATSLPRRRKLWLATAAALFLTLAAAWFTTLREEYHTAFGEQRSVLLLDGSVVTLNTSTRIRVDLSKSRRAVRLLAGEAFFQVAPDAQRPFDVIAGNATIRAVGTEFNVDMRPAATTVTVVEGKVSLSTVALKSRGAAAPAQPLGALERVVISSTSVGKPEVVSSAAPVTAWTRRLMIFEGRALVEVADEFNRYNRQRITILAPALQQREVTGVFQASDIESFRAFLEATPDIHVEVDERGDIFVRAAAENISGGGGANVNPVPST